MPRKSEPTERTCIVTRETKPIGDLLRFVLGPEGEVVPDLKRTLPGRGVWVSATRAAVETATRKRLFGRGFGEEAKADPGLPDLVDRLLANAALGTLGLARKAGHLVAGFAKVEAAVRSGEAIGLVHASEAAEDGVSKLAAALRRRPDGGKDIPVVRTFSGAQLDLALGRSNVVHAAVLAGRAGEIFLERHHALERYRGGPAAPVTATDRTRGGDAPQD
ncbi:RNA-binding protein [Prosthecomicrobium sp. N25]|uniref:RNA-binding protein n=1 Tax=Prosthecomicrobium sp. N25 TaxID=3129254 RepID=UPI003077B8A8